LKNFSKKKRSFFFKELFYQKTTGFLLQRSGASAARFTSALELLKKSANPFIKYQSYLNKS